jgi:uncharacterized membrane protein
VSTAKSESLTGSSLHVDWLRVVSIVLCIAGIFVAGYMSWAEATGNETVCTNTGSIDCSAVQTSAYAKTAGIPVANMGLLGYMAILLILVLEDQVEFLAAYGRTLVVSVALGGVIFQTYLTYIEAFVLEKWCEWCVTSYIMISLLFVIGAYRVYRFLQPLQHR